jgi:SAM-dependent methyltransferase
MTNEQNDQPQQHRESGSAEQFWEAHYQKGPRSWTGRPNAVLAQWAGTLAPSTALDLGCSEGNSAVWLAQQGWQVTGVDVSRTALERATEHAAAAGVANRTAFQQHDLSQSFPEGQFDLVYALYLQSPVNLPRTQVFQAAAQRVTPGGLLLIVEHASVAPWSWNQDARFPSPREALDTLGLHLNDWKLAFLGDPERELNGPGGQAATVKDNVIALKRLQR